jgi:hypothetical protein
MNTEEYKTAADKKEWAAPKLTVLEIESDTNGLASGVASGDGLGYS